MNDSIPKTPNTASTSRFADVLSSLVVFMVALPLCVAIAKACGLPAEAGLVTGIVGGILVGLLAGSPLQVSGPAAGLIVLVQEIVQKETQQHYALIILLAGLIQLFAGAAKMGQWFRAVSPAVVLGMLAGIGAIILAKQIPVLFDQTAASKIPDAPANIFNAVKAATADTGFNGPLAAGAIGLITLAFMVVWKPLVPKKIKLIPGAIIGVIVATVVTDLAGWNVNRVETGKLSDFFTSDRMVGASTFSLLSHGDIWKSALTLALIASAETLLCASAVDAKHSGPRTQYNQELMAQGVGNMVCGSLGALPMTGVIVRSAANIEAGGKTRLSTILHGVWLLVFVVVFPSMIQRIPIAAMAAILVYTGIKLLDIPAGRKLFRTSTAEGVIFLATAIGVVGLDLLSGVIIGVFLSAMRLLWSFSFLDLVKHTDEAANNLTLTLDGTATFLRLPIIAKELDMVKPGQDVHINLDKVDFVDHAVFDLFTSFRDRHLATGGNLILDWEKLQIQFESTKKLRDNSAKTAR